MLTLLSIVVAFMLFGFLSAIKQALTGGVSLAGANRLIVRHKVSIIQLLPESYKARMERIPGVSVGDAPDLVRRHLPGPEEFLHAESGGAGGVPGHAPGDSSCRRSRRQAWLQTRTGAIVGRSTAERFGWKIGDKVPIKSTIWARRTAAGIWTFDIVGIYDGRDKNTDTTPLFFRYDYFDEAAQLQSGARARWAGTRSG